MEAEIILTFSHCERRAVSLRPFKTADALEICHLADVSSVCMYVYACVRLSEERTETGEDWGNVRLGLFSELVLEESGVLVSLCRA